jgi:thiol-disulfide isomerase/thioredoxin
MRLIRSALLYISLALGANMATADMSSIIELREGDMKKLNFHSEPKEVSQVAFTLEDETGSATLADYQGKYVLLNFWATWCAPCRAEMPMLSALQDEFGGDDFEVLTLATGRNSPKGIEKFFADAGITNLPRHQDHKQALARQMGVLGLPVTIILNPEGQEIARLLGDAEWNSDSARAIVAALLAPTTDG